MRADATVDVLVVGLGPAGARAARAAADAGASVLAVDRRRRPGVPVQCAEFVPAPLGQELGSLDAVTRQPIEAMATYVEEAAPDLKDDFPGRIIDRAAFDAALARAAAAAGAECRFAVRLAALCADGTAQLSDGETLRPRLVIGADGPRSRVGGAIGRTNRQLVETRQLTVPLLRTHKATDVYLAANIPGGYGWLFPKGEVANLGLGVAPWARGRLKPRLEALRQRLIGEGRIGAAVLACTGGAIPVGGMLEPSGALGPVPVLLAGDAAGLANPVTGAGIAAAVVSGTLAGQAGAAWCAGEAAALGDYVDELEDLFDAALRRAVRRRRELLRRYRDQHGPSPAALRRGWVAYPEYWAA